MSADWTWTARKELAALRVAEDQQPDTAIAQACGVVERTLERWKRHPVFAARVQAHVARLGAVALQRGIAQREKRVAALDERWQGLQRVIAERAADPAHAAVAGWQTGLLVFQLKSVGRGEDFQLVREYAVDTGLLRELRAHEEQAAKELGQWTDKLEHSGAVSGSLTVQHDFDFAAFERLYLELAGPARPQLPDVADDGVGEPLDPAHPDGPAGGVPDGSPP